MLGIGGATAIGCAVGPDKIQASGANDGVIIVARVELASKRDGGCAGNLGTVDQDGIAPATIVRIHS